MDDITLTINGSIVNTIIDEVTGKVTENYITSSFVETVAENMDMYSLAEAVTDQIDMYDLSNRILGDLDYEDIASSVSEHIDHDDIAQMVFALYDSTELISKLELDTAVKEYVENEMDDILVNYKTDLDIARDVISELVTSMDEFQIDMQKLRDEIVALKSRSLFSRIFGKVA